MEQRTPWPTSRPASKDQRLRAFRTLERPASLLLGLIAFALAAVIHSSTVTDVYAAGTICGTLPAGITTLSARMSPYSLCATGATVPGGSTLVVEPLVRVNAAGAGGIVVYGTLNAPGEKLGSIIFTSSSATPAAGSWAGISFRADTATTPNRGTGLLSGVVIRYAGTALDTNSGATSLSGGLGLSITNSSIESSTTGVAASNTSVSLSNTTIDRTTTGIDASSGSVSVTGGTISNIAGTGVSLQIPAFGGSDGQLTVTGVAFDTVGGKAISTSNFSFVGIQRLTSSMTNNSIARAGTAGTGAPAIEVDCPGCLGDYESATVSGNTITGSSAGVGTSGKKYPVIRLARVATNLGSVPGQPSVFGNTGSGNGLDAIELDSVTVSNSFAWQTPRANAASTDPLGYLVNRYLTLSAGTTLTVGKDDVVKLAGGSNSGIFAYGAHLVATAGGAVVTSMRDSSSDATKGVLPTCPSALAANCSPAGGDWGYLYLTKGTSGTSTIAGDATFAGATIRFGTNALYIDSGATTLPGGVGLSVSNTTIDSVSAAGIYSYATPVSVSGGTISNVARIGIWHQGSDATHKLTVDGVNFINILYEGIVVENLANPTSPLAVSLTNNTVTNAGTYIGGWPAIKVVYSDNLVLRGNKVIGSGTGSNGIKSPVIRLDSDTISLGNVTGQPSVFGNTGNGNGLDAIELLNVTVRNSFGWQTPRANGAATDPLGYLVNFDLSLSPNTTMTLAKDDVVKAASGGTIRVNGAHLDASAGGAVLTSVRDTSFDAAKNVLSTCPSSLAADCVAAPGDWGGVAITETAGTSPIRGDASLSGASVRYAATGLAITSSATSLTGGVGLSVTGSTFDNSTKNAISVGAAAKAAVSNSRFTSNGGATDYAINADGPVSVDCSSIHGNGSGLRSNAAGTSTVNGDLFGNTGTNRFDLFAGVATPARNTWWGQATGPSAGQVGGTGGYDASGFLVSQSPTVAITFSSLNTDANGAFGAGPMSVNLVFSRKMDVTVSPSVVVFSPNPHPVSGSWLDPLTWRGTYNLDPSTDSPGSTTLTANGARSCVPEPTTNLMAQASATFNVNFAIFYFAEGFTGSGFQETLNLFTPNGAGTATIDYYTPAGHTTGTVSLVKGQVKTVDVNAAFGSTQQVSVKVTLPASGVVERVLHFNNGPWHGSTDIVGTNSPATEWDFAEGSTLSVFSEFLTLQNINAGPVVVDLNYFTDRGDHPSKRLTLPASSRTTVEVFHGDLTSSSAECVPNGSGASCGVGPGIGGVSAQVRSRSLPIVVERPFYVNNFSFGSGPIKDGHVAFGATTPAKTWNFAEGTTLPGFNEYLTLQNATSSATTVDLKYFTNMATIHPVKTLVVPANSRVTIEVFHGDTLDWASCSYGANGTCGVGPDIGGVSVQVVSRDQPIVAERPMYMYLDFGGVPGAGVVAGAHVVVGATSLGTLFGFANASSAVGENDYLTIQNPGAAAASVSATYYTSSGPVKKAFTVAAGSRVTVELFRGSTIDDLSCSPAVGTCGTGRGLTQFGVVLQSDKAILVEKPTYSSNADTYGATDTLAYLSPGF